MINGPKSNIIVTNMDELFEVYLDLLDKTESVYLTGYDMSKLTSSPTVIKFDNGESDSSGVVTAEMAHVIIDIQEQIYRIASAAKGRRLSAKEKKGLTLKVIVKPGCTELIFNILKSLIPEVSKMSADQLTTVKDMVITVTSLIAVWKIGVPIAKGTFNTIKNKIALSRAKAETESKEKLADIDLQKQKIEAELQKAKDSQKHEEEMARIEAESQETLAKLESEMQIALAHVKSWLDALDRSENVVSKAMEGTNSICNTLAKIPYDICVNNTSYSKEELEVYGQEEEPEMPDVVTENITDEFYVKRKNYTKGDGVVYVDLINKDGSIVLNGIKFNSDAFSKEQLYEIEHHKPITLSFTCENTGGRRSNFGAFMVISQKDIQQQV